MWTAWVSRCASGRKRLLEDSVTTTALGNAPARPMPADFMPAVAAQSATAVAATDAYDTAVETMLREAAVLGARRLDTAPGAGRRCGCCAATPAALSRTSR